MKKKIVVLGFLGTNSPYRQNRRRQNQDGSPRLRVEEAKTHG